MSNLPNAIQDGARLEGLLQKFSWVVEFLTDVDLETAKDSLDILLKSWRNSTMPVSLHIGHGIELNGKNYLVSCDASLDCQANERRLEQDLIQTCMPFTFVEETFAEVRNIQKTQSPSIFLLDCCRDDLSGNSGRAPIRYQPAPM